MTSDECADLLAELDAARGFLRYTVRDLSDEQARLHTTDSLAKHVDVGIWFAAIAAGYAVDKLIGAAPAASRHRAITTSAVVIALAFPLTLGASQSTALATAWPNSTSLIAILGPADMFGELALFDPGPRTSTVTTLTAVQALTMDRDALRAWIADRPEIAEQLLRVLARRLRRTNNNLADLIFTDVPGRVAKQLLQLAQRFGTQEGGAMRVTHDLTQEEIAQLVGASRETVNKALADFAHRGWIRLEGKSVLISDSERLARRAR